MKKFLDEIIFVCTIFMVFFIALPTTINAADFVFKVPVELNNLASDITHVKVKCEVSKLGSFQPIGSQIIAAGFTNTVTISGRKFKGTLIARLNVREGQNPNKAHSYRVHLMFKGKNGWFPPYKDHPKYPADTTKPCQTLVKGNL